MSQRSLIRARHSVCFLLRAAVVLLLAPGCGRDSATAQTAATTNPPAASPGAGQTIAGRVVSSVDGHPLHNARVTLAPQLRTGRRAGPQAAPPLTALTDAEGRYRMAAPTAGRYTLRATAPGYLNSLYLQHEDFSSAVVTGTALPTDDLGFALVPEASLHGRILDDTGEPVRATVMLYRDASDSLPSAALANEDQAYAAGWRNADR